MVDASITPRNAISPDKRILVSEDEACMLLGVSKPTLRGWVAEGIVSPVQLPHGIRRRLFKRADLEAWVASLTDAPTTPAQRSRLQTMP